MTRRKTAEEFINEAKALHGDTYSYSKVAYISQKEKVTLACSVHGDFQQTPSDHLAGKGCRKCGTEKSAKTRSVPFSEYVAKAKQVHQGRYEYPVSAIENNKSKIEIVCKEHGSFWQAVSGHLSGKGCPKCAFQDISDRQYLSQEEFLERAKEVHGETYDYSETVYERSDKLVHIRCKEHGLFSKRPSAHWLGEGCPSCSLAARVQSQFKTNEQFIKDAVGKHGEEYDYAKTAYTGSKDPVAIVCSKGHEFTQRPNDHLTGHGCSVCLSAGASEPELEIQEFLRSLGVEVKANCRKTLGNGQELDIVFGNYAVEYNGLYWHSEAYRDKSFHREKTALAKSAGVKLFHVFEDQWLDAKEKVKERLRAKLGLGHKVHARKLKVQQIGWRRASEFYAAHHLQGAGQAGKTWALVEDSTLRACLTVGFRNGSLEIYRYSSNGTVMGGFGKLFQAYLKASPEADRVISYADLCWGEGEVYGTQGFIRLPDVEPSYYWIKKLKRYSRQKFQKHKLKKLLPNFDEKLTEVENMHNHGFLRIYDCGHAKWEWKKC